jgi:hypothetical protein
MDTGKRMSILEQNVFDKFTDLDAAFKGNASLHSKYCTKF